MANMAKLPASLALVIGGELRAVIGDVNRHEFRRLRSAGILGEQMDRARRLEEGAARNPGFVPPLAISLLTYCGCKEQDIAGFLRLKS
jgi:hypothetical protein